MEIRLRIIWIYTVYTPIYAARFPHTSRPCEEAYFFLSCLHRSLYRLLYMSVSSTTLLFLLNPLILLPLTLRTLLVSVSVRVATFTTHAHSFALLAEVCLCVVFAVAGEGY